MSLSADTFSLLERLHGHAAMLGLALLLHPVIALRGGRISQVPQGTRIAAGLSATLLALPSLGGWLLYPGYRREIKPTLAQRAPELMLAFESKEHLAWLCLCLALGGAACLLLAPRSQAAITAGRHLMAASFVLGLVCAALGLVVASGASAL